MARFVVDGATCKCTLGAVPGVLGGVQCPAVQGGGRPTLNVMDTSFSQDFGGCRRDPATCRPCKPAPVGIWSNDAASIQFGLHASLVETATLACAHGGTISIEDPGQDTARFDATYVMADGTVAILNNVTQEELDRYKRADQTRAALDRLDAAREDPLKFWLGELAGGLIEGAGKAAEERSRIRSIRPVTRGR